LGQGSSSNILESAKIQLAETEIQVDWNTILALLEFTKPLAGLSSEKMLALRNPQLWVHHLAKRVFSIVNVASSMKNKRFFLKKLEVEDLIFNIALEKISELNAEVNIGEDLLNVCSLGIHKNTYWQA